MDISTELILNKVLSANFTKPLTYVDLFLAMFISVSLLVYLRRFPMFRVILGVLFLLTGALIFFLLGFIFTSIVVGGVAMMILISLPLIFAPEVRHYMEKLGRFSFVKVPTVSKQQRNKQFINNLLDGIYSMAERKIGALIVLQRRTRLGDLIESGVVIDAQLGSKLLENIFYPNNPLHDGAVVIVGGRVLAARCTVPISHQVKLDPPFGLRHKAGLSITRETDAVSIVVSEQRGEVTLIENGKWEVDVPRAVLSERLLKLM